MSGYQRICNLLSRHIKRWARLIWSLGHSAFSLIYADAQSRRRCELLFASTVMGENVDFDASAEINQPLRLPTIARESIASSRGAMLRHRLRRYYSIRHDSNAYDLARWHLLISTPISIGNSMSSRIWGRSHHHAIPTKMPSIIRPFRVSSWIHCIVVDWIDIDAASAMRCIVIGSPSISMRDYRERSLRAIAGYHDVMPCFIRRL